MTDLENTVLHKPAKTQRRKLIDILLVLVFITVCFVLAKNLMSQLSLKNEIKAATTTTNQVINAIQKQDGKAVHNLGNKSFQAQNSTDNLNAQFEAAQPFTTSKPTIERKTVTNDKSGQAVSIIYKFPKPVFYIRVIVTKAKTSDKFQVANLKASPTQKPLLNNKY